MKRSRKLVTSSNLDTATPEQLDKVYQNVADAVSLLYKSVKERKIKESLLEITKQRYISESERKEG